jgi:putative membrane protein
MSLGIPGGRVRYEYMEVLPLRFLSARYSRASGLEVLQPYRSKCIPVSWPLFLQLQAADNAVHVHPIIVTILGILVGFSLHLRSSTAYERYMEGRKVWSSLNGVSVNLARNIWCHAKEREGELVKKDLLAKISFCNLIVAFAIALKHKVRFEPYTQYEDLYDLVVHLDTFAKAAGKPTERSNCPVTLRHIKHLFRLAEPNPRAELKQATRPLGNL